MVTTIKTTSRIRASVLLLYRPSNCPFLASKSSSLMMPWSRKAASFSSSRALLHREEVLPQAWHQTRATPRSAAGDYHSTALAMSRPCTVRAQITATEMAMKRMAQTG